MINLFYSESYWSGNSRMNGPKKVVHNLIESLKYEGIDYAINEEKYKNNLILQYDYNGYLQHSKLDLENCIIGPQVWYFDSHVNELKENSHYYKYIVNPSKWVTDLAVNEFLFPKDKLKEWAVGITLPKIEKDIKYDCLIYYKRREFIELESVIYFLQSKGLTYNVLEYGKYSEQNLKELCNQSKFCFLLNGTESQGIAVQEIMSYNVPMIVWDICLWTDMGIEWTVPASSVPYWSEECGEKFFNEDEIGECFEKFYSRLNQYNPRKYIKENLSYKCSVNKLLELFNVN